MRPWGPLSDRQITLVGQLLIPRENFQMKAHFGRQRLIAVAIKVSRRYSIRWIYKEECVVDQHLSLTTGFHVLREAKFWVEATVQAEMPAAIDGVAKTEPTPRDSSTVVQICR